MSRTLVRLALGLVTLARVSTIRPDMINMLTLNYTPRTCCWIHGHGQATALLAMCIESALSSV